MTALGLTLPPYAELHCLSNFTFLRGASHPQELVARAAELGYAALAITDECSLAGVVRAHLEAKGRGLQLIVGTELRLEGGPKLVLLATDRASYGRLSALITRARRSARKGHYRIDRAGFEAALPAGCLALWLPDAAPEPADGAWLAGLFPGRAWIAAELLLAGDDAAKLHTLQALGRACGLPLCAAGDVHMHRRSRRALQDTLTAIRLGRPVAELGYALLPNGERHLRPRQTLARLYPPALLQETVAIAARCHFSLDELRYEYPRELVPAGHDPASWLRRLTEKGLERRWPGGAPAAVRATVERELALIHELKYEPYFLTVHDLVRFANARKILCQGRGSAANSVVCYCLGITEISPDKVKLLFERFVSRERDEPPDIDVDFEHERREEVIQYLYKKYGRERAALAATVITYRPRSAIRDVGKALGLNLDCVDALAKSVQWWDGKAVCPEQLQGLDPASPLTRQLAALTTALIGFPRHLSQHTGGFVIAQEQVSQLVPIENAAMPERTVIQWDKDDLEELGLLKVDVLALGMLSAIRKAFELIHANGGPALTMAGIPQDDPAVYAMLCRGDSVGVFQVESRAQMAMLPRLKPRNYYDLVVQIAIVRPGPIQGEMVHPYLERRQHPQQVDYPSEAVKNVLERTLGVPIFQEQVMSLAVVAAGFTPGKADRLRRAMAAWKRKGGLEPFEDDLMAGLRANGYTQQFARQIFKQIRGFGEYGFPESHSASFALLAYVSAWLKHHYPAAFTCALLNSQPMGFYAPAQLVADAKRHGVEVRPADVQHSRRDCSLERAPAGHALRLGLHRVKGLSKAGAEALVAARAKRPFTDLEDLSARGGLDNADLEALAAADALAGLAGHRHRAFWQVRGVEKPLPLIRVPRFRETRPLLRAPREGEDIAADYRHTGLTLRRHPLALLRERLQRRGVRTAAGLWDVGNDGIARTAGLVIGRQRPGAGGVVFVTLEDETGCTNVIVWASHAEAQRRPLLAARLMAVTGKVQKQDSVLHLIAGRMEDWSAWLGGLDVASRDFH